MSNLDVLVASTLARSARAFHSNARGAAAGVEFEQAMYQSLSTTYSWRYATPPDQFNLGLQLATRTGTQYEHDGMVASDETLYTLEAKWYTSPITRQIVGIVVQKLFDTLLGSQVEIGHFRMKSLILAGHSGADAAAFRYAASFGILLITPERPTPHEILDLLRNDTCPGTNARQQLERDCELLAPMLWRPFDQLLRPGPDASTRTLVADSIFTANQTAQIAELWDECLASAASLDVLRPIASPTTSV